MKNMKAIGLLILALVVGLAAAVYAASWVAQRGNLASTKVVVAAVDIEMGSKINPQMLTSSDWPSDSVPPGAFRDAKELQGRVVKAAVLRGDPVVERKLSPAGTQGGLSAVIAEGKRAMTVRVNDVVGVAGFAKPGNYVDVVLNTHDAGRGDNQFSVTVLEKVLVLAVAQEANRDETKPKVVSAVTLELSPADAEKLDLARSVGSLSLVLRNQLDKQSVATAGITRSQLLGLKVTQTAAAPIIKAKATAVRTHGMGAPPVVLPSECVEVIRVGTRVMNCF